MSVLDDLLKEPTINAALIGTIVAALLYVQSIFRERTRKRETEAAREKIAAATADKVVEKITNASMMPLPLGEERITSQDTPEAKVLAQETQEEKKP